MRGLTVDQERVIFESLMRGEFLADWGPKQLEPVIRHLIWEVVQSHPAVEAMGGVQANVPAAEVVFPGGEVMGVKAVVHVHTPVTGFVEIGYSLGNDLKLDGLTPLPGSVRVKIVTSRFDLFARTVFGTLGIPRLVANSLRDVNSLVLGTLNPHLRSVGSEIFPGYDQGIFEANFCRLCIQPEGTLRVHLRNHNNRLAPGYLRDT